MKIAVIGDTQVKPGINMDYLTYIGRYLEEKRPDVIVNLGDFWDMQSLSSYDKGKKAAENRRYKADIEAGNLGMELLLGPINEYNANAVKNHKPRYKPRKIFCRGNHEARCARAANDDAWLEGQIGYQDMNLDGWEVYDFLEVVTVEGVAFSHYFTSGLMGRPVTSAAALLAKKHMSCVAGHQQGKQVAHAVRADGQQMTAVILGSSYDHNEDYLGPQGNKHFRGIMMMHEVEDGAFDESFISLNFLRKKYG
jgi:hypothetical protein